MKYPKLAIVALIAAAAGYDGGAACGLFFGWLAFAILF